MATLPDFEFQRDSILTMLRVHFGDAHSVSIDQALSAIPGISDSREAARKRKERGTYPFPIRCAAGHHYVLLADIATTLAAAPVTGTIRSLDAANDQSSPDPTPRRGPGRPRKSKVAGGAE